MLTVSKMSARTRIHCGNEEETARESETSGGTGNGNEAIFEWLTEDFQDVALKFGEFVKEEDTIVSEADFAGLRIDAAAQKTGIADGMMRGTERAFAEERFARGKDAQGGVNAAGFESFLLGHGRENAGHTLSEHTFAGAGRSDENDVMSACGGDFEGAFCGALTFDLAEIGDVLPVGFQKEIAGIGSQRGNFAGKSGDRFPERADRINFHGGSSDSGFGTICGGDNQRGDMIGFAGKQSRRKDAFDGANGSVESEFAQNHGGAEEVGRESIGGGDEFERDGEIECRAFLADIRRSQIDEGETFGMTVAGSVQGTANAFLAFADSGIGQTYD